ncbi:GntR family transcriptional regulator [Vagococcus sp. PNs007]|uniref:GntR family transcriptional regulator n=1 Tax=Vagococcus proximus TaxID=2991417 RepID=A0ABT5X0C9_9ENTE|nr:GntR family transcriptional regulator [Vagococcus proximus]MDF0479461.1 GntR family transcriptional regulator [Vagococcus proximus]
MKTNKTARSVQEKIRHQIELGILKPGSRIIETDIAEEFKVSRSPVRAACDLLVEEGILTKIPYRGLIVNLPKITEKEFVDRLDVFELLVIQYFFYLEKQLINLPVSEIEEQFEALKKVKQSGDVTDIIRRELLFFQVLVSSHKNVYYQKLLTTLLDELLNSDPLFYRQDSDRLSLVYFNYFTDIWESLKIKDYPKARRDVRLFINDAKLNVLDQQEIMAKYRN